MQRNRTGDNDMSTKQIRRRAISIEEILRWADAHRAAIGKWPTRNSGDIPGSKFDSWFAVDAALRDGLRGLPGGSSLARLLSEHRGARNIHGLPTLTEEQILQWADEHHSRTGDWPTAESGPIPKSGGEKWQGIDRALSVGSRGLSPGSSIAKLLADRRGTRNRKQLPSLTERQILAWADAHYERTGSWPTAKSGPISHAPGETWLAVNMALRHGHRGLVGKSSLAVLLAAERNVRNPWNRPDLSIESILRWADAFYAREGQWPTGIGSHPRCPGRILGSRQSCAQARKPGTARRMHSCAASVRRTWSAEQGPPSSLNPQNNTGLGDFPSSAHRRVANQGVRPRLRRSD